MGSHACDRVLRLSVIVTLLAALAGCSGRSTNPEDNGEPEPAIHEPWEDEEAELLALLMSGELCAPRDLYERVSRDLAAIRSHWGDSIPQLHAIHYRPRWSASHLSFGVDDDAFEDIESGTYSAWDSLNSYYDLNEVIIEYSQFGGPPHLALKFTPRINPSRLTEAYAGLPGIRWIQPSGNFEISETDNLYVYLRETGPAYLFKNAESCRLGCLTKEYWYFRVKEDGLEFAGSWNARADTTRPEWWDEAYLAEESYYDSFILWEREDDYQPTAITDLLAGNPGSNSVTLSWTAPFDSSYSGRVGAYHIAYSTSMITEETWKNARVARGPAPNLPGTHERFTLKGLYSSTNYYFALKSSDADGNSSYISNVANAATTAAIGWASFDSANAELPGNTVTSLAADRNGGIWAGTTGGIAHFNGSDWQAYFSAETGMDDGRITGIAVDGYGKAWCTTYKGVHVFDGANWTVIDWHDIGLPGLPLSAASDPLGNIWVGSVSFGAAKHDASGWTVTQLPSGPSTYDGCASIAFGPDGDVWFGTYSKGVFRRNGSNWTVYDKQTSGIGSNSARSVALTSDGVLWVAHDVYPDGVSRFDGTTWTNFDYHNSPLPYRVRFVVIDATDRVWFPSAGAIRYDGTSFSACGPANSGLIADNVTCIAQDAQGNMWFGTDRGVSRLAAEYIDTYLGETAEEGL